MPDLSEFVNEMQEEDLVVRGTSLHVSFDPDYFTPELEEQIERADKRKASRLMAKIVSDMVDDWDLTKGGEAFPPTEENCRTLPLLFLADLINAIAEASKPSEAEGKVSPVT